MVYWGDKWNLVDLVWGYVNYCCSLLILQELISPKVMLGIIIKIVQNSIIIQGDLYWSLKIGHIYYIKEN